MQTFKHPDQHFGVDIVADYLNTPRDQREGYLATGRIHEYGANIKTTTRIPSNYDTELDPIIIVPGFEGIKTVYADFRDVLAEMTGRVVTTYRMERIEEKLPVIGDFDWLLHPDKLGKQAVVAVIDSVSQKTCHDKVALIGHSMGGPYAVEAALRRLDKVSLVALLGSGALEVEAGAMKFAGRLPSILKDDVLPGVRMISKNLSHQGKVKLLVESTIHTFSNLLRTIGESLEVGNRGLMEEEIRELRENAISVIAIQLADDKFFPLDVAVRDAKKIVDEMLVMPGAIHVSPNCEPDKVAAFLAANVFDKFGAPNLRSL